MLLAYAKMSRIMNFQKWLIVMNVTLPLCNAERRGKAHGYCYSNTRAMYWSAFCFENYARVAVSLYVKVALALVQTHCFLIGLLSNIHFLRYFWNGFVVFWRYKRIRSFILPTFFLCMAWKSESLQNAEYSQLKPTPSFVANFCCIQTL
jgi:hypothetical protein